MLVTVGSDERLLLPPESGPTQQSCMTKLTLLMQRVKLPGARAFMLSCHDPVGADGYLGRDRLSSSGRAGMVRGILSAMPPAPFQNWTCLCLLVGVSYPSPRTTLKDHLRTMAEIEWRSRGSVSASGSP